MGQLLDRTHSYGYGMITMGAAAAMVATLLLLLTLYRHNPGNLNPEKA